MRKSEILIVGAGGCGCNQLSTILDLDMRFTGIFMNTNLSEMENLPHFNRERNSFYISNADGTGRDRNLAESYIKEEAPKFADMIKKFVNQPYVIFLSSMSGGTGSKAIILLSILTKKFCPEKSLNIVTTFPGFEGTENDYENAIDTWNELINLQNKSIIDSIQFIDNTMCDSEETININAMKLINDSFEIIGGKLDATDSKRVHTSKGYKVILKLDESIKDTSKAVDDAINKSIFFTPNKFEPNVVVGNINTNIFDLDVIRKKFDAYEFTKFNENKKKDNILILSGLDMPKTCIEFTQEALKEAKSRKKTRITQENLIVERDDDKKVESNNIDTPSRLSGQELNNIFNDNFWDN